MSRLFAATPASIFRWLGAKLAVRASGRCRAQRRPSPAFPCASACAGMLFLAACGGDDSASPAPAQQQQQDAGVMPQRATPAVTATAGTSGSGSLAGAPLDAPLACGSAACTRPKNVAAGLLMSITGLPMTGAETVACCLDDAAGTCSSAASTGAACDTIAVADQRCPGVDLSALSDLVGVSDLGDSFQEAMVGCCTHDACGVDGKLFGRGCVEDAEAKRMLSAVPVIGPLINVPPPRACNGHSNDAGVTPPPAADGDAGA